MSSQESTRLIATFREHYKQRHAASHLHMGGAASASLSQEAAAEAAATAAATAARGIGKSLLNKKHLSGVNFAAAKKAAAEVAKKAAAEEKKEAPKEVEMAEGGQKRTARRSSKYEGAVERLVTEEDSERHLSLAAASDGPSRAAAMPPKAPGDGKKAEEG